MSKKSKKIANEKVVVDAEKQQIINDLEKQQVSGGFIKRRLYTDSDRKDGAKSKFDKVNKEIIERTRRGLSKKDRIAGLIHETTFRDWLAAGEQDIIAGIKSQYSLFSFQIADAEREYRDGLLECIKNQAPNDWKAATWLMERSDPESYKLKDKVDVVSNGETIGKPFFMPIKDQED